MGVNRRHYRRSCICLSVSGLRNTILGIPLLVIAMSACKPDAPLISARPQPPDELRLDRTDVPSLPDLHLCTRAELRYLPSTIEYFFPSNRDLRLLSNDEIAYLRALQSVSIDDRRHLDALAGDLEQVVYEGRITGSPRISEVIEITCYRGAERLPAFVACWDVVLTASGDHFSTKGNGLPSIMRDPVPDVGPFFLRVRCAHNLWFLYHGIWRYRGNTGQNPDPLRWCDDVKQSYSQSYSEMEIVSRFACPAAKKGRCHYAMNPRCTLKSPPDTVLLFETAPGWNQHGGPEAFAFDHHDPEGGCVLLNDAADALSYPTVLFIRTRQELERLRWE